MAGLLGALANVGKKIVSRLDDAAVRLATGLSPVPLRPEDFSPDQRRLLRAMLLSSIGSSLYGERPGMLREYLAYSAPVIEPIITQAQEQQIRKEIDAAPTYAEKAAVAAKYGLDGLASMFRWMAEQEQKQREPVGGVQMLRDPSGKTVAALVDRSGKVTPLEGYSAPPETATVDVGGQVLLVDKNTGKPITEFGKSVSPDTQANIASAEGRFQQSHALEQSKFEFDRERWQQEQALRRAQINMAEQELKLKMAELAQPKPLDTGAAKQVIMADQALRIYEQMDQMISSGGLSFNPRDPRTQELANMANLALLLVKDTFGLGALQAYEFKLVEKLAQDPTSLKALGIGSNAVLAAIRSARKLITGLRDDLLKGYGAVRTPAGAIVRPSLLSGGDTAAPSAAAPRVYRYIPGQGLVEEGRR